MMNYTLTPHPHLNKLFQLRALLQNEDLEGARALVSAMISAKQAYANAARAALDIFASNILQNGDADMANMIRNELLSYTLDDSRWSDT